MIKLLTLIPLILSILFAKSESISKIELQPIATSKDGFVLFSTYAMINKTGSYSCSNEQYGWLAVHNSGAWDEILAFESMDDKCMEVNATKHKLYEKNKYDLKNPDESLELMSIYGFDENSTLKNNHATVALKAHQSCFQGECIDEVLKSRSILNYKKTGLIKPIHSSFYYQGVALFKNRMDGLLLFNPKDFQHAGQTSLSNLMHKVNTQKSFYPYCFHMYRTDCFMHEEFKIDGFSKDSFAYTVYEGMDDAVEDEFETFVLQSLKDNKVQELVDISYEEEALFKNDKYYKTKRVEKVNYNDINYTLNWHYKNEDVSFNPEHVLYSSSRLKKLLMTKLKKHRIQKEKNVYLYDFPLNYKGKKIDFRVEKKSHGNDDTYSGTFIDFVSIYRYINGKKTEKFLSKKFGKEETPLLAYEVLGYIPVPRDESRIILLISYLNRGWEGMPHVTHFKLLSVKL